MFSCGKVNVYVFVVFVGYALVVPVILIRKQNVVVILIWNCAVNKYTSVGIKASHYVLTNLKAEGIISVVGNGKFPCNGLSGLVPCGLSHRIIALLSGVGGIDEALGAVVGGVKGRCAFVKVVFTLNQNGIGAYYICVGKSGSIVQLGL